jgi:prefoldin subunit 5
MPELSPQQTRRLQKLADVIDNGNLAIVKHLFEIEETIDEKIKELDSKLPNLDKVLESIKGKDGRDGEKGDVGPIGPIGPTGKDGKSVTGPIGPMGPAGRDGKDGIGIKGDRGADGKDGSPDTPEQIRDKLEELPEDEKLKIEAIKNLRQELDKLKSMITSVGNSNGKIIGGSGRYVNVPMVDDLSSLTDGSTKTFYLAKAPRNTNTIMVFGSDFPIILRPNIDFTIAGKLLTLTSAVPAPSQGATLVVNYQV